LPKKIGVLNLNKIYVVGIGPGRYEEMSIRAARVLENCNVIVGYTVYVDLVREHFKAKFISTPMRQEKERCTMAFQEAKRGEQVAVICSGDPEVYGLASLMFEIGEEYPSVEIEVVGGMTAALSAGAVLGAPLNHDFSLISLSDLLTPWEVIEKRIRVSAQGDFIICFYNPSSHKRSDYLKKACSIMLEFKEGGTVCGLVKNIGRAGEESKVMSLKELVDYEADMFTTIIVGNNETKVINGKMVTPRGYKL